MLSAQDQAFHDVSAGLRRLSRARTRPDLDAAEARLREDSLPRVEALDPTMGRVARAEFRRQRRIALERVARIWREHKATI